MLDRDYVLALCRELGLAQCSGLYVLGPEAASVLSQRSATCESLTIFYSYGVAKFFRSKPLMPRVHLVEDGEGWIGRPTIVIEGIHCLSEDVSISEVAGYIM